MTTEERLLQLEQQLTTLRQRQRAMSLCLVAAVALACLGAAAPEQEEICAQRIRLIDAKGRDCGLLQAGPHGGQIDLNLVNGHEVRNGFHAEAGELRVREIHGDDMIYVGMIGTRCYGRLSVEPPASAQLRGEQRGTLEMRSEGHRPELTLRSASSSYRLGPDGPFRLPDSSERSE